MSPPKKEPPASGFDLTALLWGDIVPDTSADHAPAAEPTQSWAATAIPALPALTRIAPDDESTELVTPVRVAIREVPDDTYDAAASVVPVGAEEHETRPPITPGMTASVSEDDDHTGIEIDEYTTDDFEIEEILDSALTDLIAQDDADDPDQEDELPLLIDQLDERPLSVTLLTERLQRDVLPRLRLAAGNPGYLTLGKLAYAVAALQGSETHLQQVRELVASLDVPIVPSRAHHNVRNLPRAAMREASRRFGDLLQGQPPEDLVISRFGYADLPLSVGTRAFLVQAWMGHCLSRLEEREHADRVAAEVERAGTDLKRWSAEALTSREALILDNLWSVVRIARKYIGQGVDIDDLIQFGTLGLLRAIEKNDPGKNYRFVTYASSWIWQRITRELAGTAHLIRLPIHVQQRSAGVMQANIALRERSNNPPTAEQVAAEAGVTVNVARALLITAYPVSLDQPGRLAWIERHALPSDDDLDGSVSAQFLAEQIDEVLASLTERERRVIELRFGLDIGEKRTLEEAGREFGVTRERIRQIEAKAIKKLRHPRRAEKLGAFADLVRGGEPGGEQPEPSAEAIAIALLNFPDDERPILAAYLGLEGQERHGIEDVCEEFGVSQKNVLRLEKRLRHRAQRLASTSTEAIRTISITSEYPGSARPPSIYTHQLSMCNDRYDCHLASTHRADESPRRTAKRPSSPDGSAARSGALAVSPLFRSMQYRPTAAQVRAILPQLQPHERKLARQIYSIAATQVPNLAAIAAENGLPVADVQSIDRLTRAYVAASQLRVTEISAVPQAQAEEQRTLPAQTKRREERGMLTDRRSEEGLHAQINLPIHLPTRNERAAISSEPPSVPPVSLGNGGIHFSPIDPAKVQFVLSQFSDYERLITDALFGVTTGTPMAVADVAADFGVSLDTVADLGTRVQLQLDAHTAGIAVPQNETGKTTTAPAEVAGHY